LNSNQMSSQKARREKGSQLLPSEPGVSCNSRAWARKRDSWCAGMQAEILFSYQALSTLPVTHTSHLCINLDLDVSEFSY